MMMVVTRHVAAVAYVDLSGNRYDTLRMFVAMMEYNATA